MYKGIIYINKQKKRTNTVQENSNFFYKTDDITS